MVIVVYLCIIFLSAIQSASTKLFNRQSSRSTVFNAIKSLTALVLFAVMSLPSFEFWHSCGNTF